MLAFVLTVSNFQVFWPLRKRPRPISRPTLVPSSKPTVCLGHGVYQPQVIWTDDLRKYLAGGKSVHAGARSPLESLLLEKLHSGRHADGRRSIERRSDRTWSGAGSRTERRPLIGPGDGCRRSH